MNNWIDIYQQIFAGQNHKIDLNFCSISPTKMGDFFISDPTFLSDNAKKVEDMKNPKRNEVKWDIKKNINN